MAGKLLSVIFILTSFFASAQEILLLDRFNGNGIVNDSTLTVSSSDPDIVDLTQYLTIKNNTDRTLALFLKKSINYIADSTIDYFCFGIQCWPGTELTWIPDSIAPGAKDSTFASHIVHFRRFEMPPLPAGVSSISYTIFDSTTFDYKVEASITVIYQHTLVGITGHSPTAEAVWPNPASDFINISTGVLTNSACELVIFNSTGVEVKRLNLMPDSGKITFAVTGLKPGMYFGSVSALNGQKLGFRFSVR
jgi:hypothetical protein